MIIYHQHKLRSLLVILVFTLLLSSCTQKKSIHVQRIDIKDINDIRELDSSLVIPFDYHHLVSLEKLPVQQKKEKFISLLLPSILIAKKELEFTQEKLEKYLGKDTVNIKKSKRKFIRELMVKYKAKTVDDLYHKLYTHPNSIVLAQAIIESGWGSSRFFLEANNTFGIWSYSRKENRIKASFSRDGKDIYLRKYNSLSESIQDYFKVVARGPYSKFRKERLIKKDPYQLIHYLDRYSEMGEEYVEKLRHLIRKNNLTKYDNYLISPNYLNE